MISRKTNSAFFVEDSLWGVIIFFCIPAFSSTNISQLLMVAFCLYRLPVHLFRRMLYFPKILVWLCLACFYYCIQVITLTIIGTELFDGIEGVKSVVNLLLSFVFSCLIINYINDKPNGYVYKWITLACFLHGVIALTQYLLLLFSISSPDVADLYKGRGQFVLRGLFSEPAHYSIYISLSIGFLLFYAERLRMNTVLLFGFLFLTIVLSKSLSGIALLLITVIIFMFDRISFKKMLGIVVCMLIILIYILVDGSVLERLERTFSLTDSSSAARLIGSWLVVLSFDEWWQFLFGIGIGNYEAFLSQSIVKLLGDVPFDNFKTWNVLAYIFSTGGLVALAFFSASILKLKQYSKRYLLIFTASLFAHGYLFGPFFWLFLAIGVSRNKQIKSVYF